MWPLTTCVWHVEWSSYIKNGSRGCHILGWFWVELCQLGKWHIVFVAAKLFAMLCTLWILQANTNSDRTVNSTCSWGGGQDSGLEKFSILLLSLLVFRAWKPSERNNAQEEKPLPNWCDECKWSPLGGVQTSFYILRPGTTKPPLGLRPVTTVGWWCPPCTKKWEVFFFSPPFLSLMPEDECPASKRPVWCLSVQFQSPSGGWGCPFLFASTMPAGRLQDIDLILGAHQCERWKCSFKQDTCFLSGSV